MIFSFLINKIKSLAFIFITIFRKALCCIKRRRTSNCDAIPLTHVISNSGDQATDWNNWEDENLSREPKTVQDHIDLYRKRKTQFSKEPDTEEQINFFEDMTPHIMRQTKLFVNKGSTIKNDIINRLSVMEDNVNVVPSVDLVEWEENSSGWEGDNLLSDAQKLLRENKRLEREQRVLHQQQKRQEKMMNRSLGSKLAI